MFDDIIEKLTCTSFSPQSSTLSPRLNIVYVFLGTSEKEMARDGAGTDSRGRAFWRAFFAARLRVQYGTSQEHENSIEARSALSIRENVTETQRYDDVAWSY